MNSVFVNPVLKASLKSFEIDVPSWESLAQNRNSWRATTATGAVTFEFKKIENARIKRAARKARSAALPQNEDFK